MKPIGGYFELELNQQQQNWHPHASLTLKSGRSCLQFLLASLSPKQVFIPYYTCDALIEPLQKYNINYSFYELNQNLEINDNSLSINSNDILIYINYFGLKGEYLENLVNKYNHQLWVDNTQAFFYQPKIKTSVYFNSARKFFGVPDGAYLYTPYNTFLSNNLRRNQNYRCEHLLLRHQGKLGEGYKIFQDNEQLNGEEIALMSELSEIILSQIDYNDVAQKRCQNYLYLDQILGSDNQLSSEVRKLDKDGIPFCYPYLPATPIKHEYFWEKQIFVPILWRECLNRINFIMGKNGMSLTFYIRPMMRI